MFSQPSYNTIGDEYDKKVPASGADARVRGAQFKTSPAKRGLGIDVGFEKGVKSLSEGDKYVDPGAVEKRDRIERDKKKLTPEGFKFTNPGKRSAGLGNHYGCFDNGLKHETEYVVLKKGEIPDKSQPKPKNIITGPAKRGTYGYIGTTLGKGDEYRYISDPYDAEKRRQAQEAKENAKKMQAAAFKAATKRVDYFDSQPNVAASKIYSLDKPLPARKPEPPAKVPAIAQPFKPSSPPKRGVTGTIGKSYEYKEDPYEAKEKAEREQRLRNKAQVVWKPVSSGKSLPTRSVAFHKTQ